MSGDLGPADEITEEIIERCVAQAEAGYDVAELRSRITHRYLSTACLHGEHDYCKAMVGQAGEKRPGRCKFCNALCVCHVCEHADREGE